MSTYHLYKTPTILPTRLQFYDENNAHRMCQLMQLFMINKQTSHTHTTISSKNARNNLNQHTVASIHMNCRIKYLNIVETTQLDMLFAHQCLKFSLVKRVEMLQHGDSLLRAQRRQNCHKHHPFSIIPLPEAKYFLDSGGQCTARLIYLESILSLICFVGQDRTTDSNYRIHSDLQVTPQYRIK